MIRAALIGNPNVGKTEIFNHLTGLFQKVGNFPGVTVEKKAGKLTHKGQEIEVIDLPGTYSLSCRAVDELVARNYIVEERPDVVVDILDGTSLERNLYLTILLQEMQANLVVAVNRWDCVKARGLKIDLKELSALLDCPVVPTVAISGEGIDELLDAIVDAARRKKMSVNIESYRDNLERIIQRAEAIIQNNGSLKEKYPPRWLAIKMLEGDQTIVSLAESALPPSQMMEIRDLIAEASSHE
jgi:small GTP-binding protein